MKTSMPRKKAANKALREGPPVSRNKNRISKKARIDAKVNLVERLRRQKPNSR